MRAAQSAHFSGEALFGDDFTDEEIAEWFANEAEGYANLGAKVRDDYTYGYHALNRALGYAHLPDRTFAHVVGLGSAYGDELLPIADRAGAITIVDPSKAFTVTSVGGVPVSYRQPAPSGVLPFANTSVDLLTCFGVLHHIPNVSRVISEIGRCIASDGFVLLREPIVSMGDWRQPRAGLTRHERGVPIRILENAFEQAGLRAIATELFGFSPLTALWSRATSASIYNSRIGVWADARFSRLFLANYRYHRRTVRDRFAPSSAYFVLTKHERA